MKWYDREPTNLVWRFVHHKWFRSWNRHEEMGGGSRWLWLTRPTIYNQKGDYEFRLVLVIILIPILLWAVDKGLGWFLG
jgi:hypothetical protein